MVKWSVAGRDGDLVDRQKKGNYVAETTGVAA